MDYFSLHPKRVRVHASVGAAQTTRRRVQRDEFTNVIRKRYTAMVQRHSLLKRQSRALFDYLGIV